MISVFQKIAPHRKKIDFWGILPWAWLILSYCITMGFLAFHGRAYIDSDTSSEIVLANLLNKEGGILSTNWGYSTELRVFYLQIFYRLTLLLFPHNWYMAHICGLSLWMLVLLLSYLYVGHSLGLQQFGVWGAAALACPFGLWYLWYGPFGGFYIYYMVTLLLSLGLVLHLLQPSFKSKQVIRCILLSLLCFVSGLGSIKVIMAFYLPLAVGSIFTIGLQLHKSPETLPKIGIRCLGCSVMCLVFSCIGYLINIVYLATKYSFNSHNDRVWGSFDISNLIQYWCDFLSLLGFQSTGLAFVNTSSPLFTIYGVLGALSLVLAFGVVVSIIFLIARWYNLPDKYLIVLMTFVAICFVQGSVFAFTTGSDSPNPSYWLTPLPLLFIILQMAWETAPFHFRYTHQILAISFMTCIISVSISTVHTYFTSPPRAIPELEPVADWLTENGYANGYASLWSCNILTEWSNGQLDMRSVNEYTLDVTESHAWQERLDHATPPEGKVFLLVSASELWGAHKESLRNDYNVYWDENDYLVMAFDSYDEMVTALQNAHEG